MTEGTAPAYTAGSVLTPMDKAYWASLTAAQTAPAAPTALTFGTPSPAPSSGGLTWNTSAPAATPASTPMATNFYQQPASGNFNLSLKTTPAPTPQAQASKTPAAATTAFNPWASAFQQQPMVGSMVRPQMRAPVQSNTTPILVGLAGLGLIGLIVILRRRAM